MTDVVFADTSGLKALVDARDRHHKAARRTVESTSLGGLVTTDFVVAECLTLVKMRCGHAVAARLADAFRTSQIISFKRLDDQTWDQAWAIFHGHEDKRWSFIDCTSFAFMEARQIDTAFAFDEDFSQRGFNVEPERSG